MKSVFIMWLVIEDEVLTPPNEVLMVFGKYPSHKQQQQVLQDRFDGMFIDGGIHDLIHLRSVKYGENWYLVTIEECDFND